MGERRTSPLPAGLPGVRSGAFVGRRAELEVFEELWAAVGAGSRRAVFLGGEPGVGKSRLAAEVVLALHDAGATAMWGASFADLDVPYRPFVSALDGLLRAVDRDGLSDVVGDDAPVLLPLVPAVARHLPVSVAVPEPAAPTPVQLFDAVTRVLVRLTERAPVVLVLEDLHWAGGPTSQMLKHVVRSRPDIRLLLIGTHRTTAPDRSDEVSYAIADLYTLEGVRRLDLAGLGTDEIADYLAVTARQPRGRTLGPAAVLRDQTGGNPFLLHELCSELDTPEAFAALTGPALRAPTTVRASIDRRLAGLDAAHVDVLELAAVAGDRVELADLVAAHRGSDESVLAAVDVAVGAGLLAEDGTRPGRFVFRHALLRQAILARVGATARAAMHARLAAAIGEAVDGDPETVARLARHYEASHVLANADKAVAYLVRAAEHAERAVAHSQAGELYERAAALPPTTVQPRHELQLDAVAAFTRGGDFARARELAARIAVAAEPQVALRAAVLHEDASWPPGFHGHDSLELLDTALRRYGGSPEDRLVIRATASRARALSFTGADAAAKTTSDHAVAAARTTGDDGLLAHALACTLWRGMTPALAPVLVARSTELTELSERLADDSHLGPAAFYRAIFGYMTGDPAAWTTSLGLMDDCARRTGEPFMRYVAVCGAYARAYALGVYDVARHHLDALAELGEAFGPLSTEGSHGIQTFLLERATGRLGLVRHVVTGDEGPPEHWPPALTALYADIGMEAATARILPETLARLERGQDSSPQRAGVLAFAVDAATSIGSRASAERLVPMLEPYAGMNLVAGQFVSLFGAADRYLGMLESSLGIGDPDGRFEAALDLDRRMRATTHQVETLRVWSRHVRARGDERRARSMIAEADALASSIGYARELWATGSGADATTRVGPADLTGRELEVLRLVAAGRSNREIGAELHISQNTAANHVRSILMKTAAPNRTSAAMFAAEHGLLAGDDR